MSKKIEFENSGLDSSGRLVLRIPIKDSGIYLAAPKMYEALKQAITDLHTAYDGEQCDHDANVCFCGVFDTIAKGEKALAKAKEK